jgi:pyroglutamyl-peptidase
VSETILVTGFEPFGGIAGNPTMDIVAALHGRRLDNRQIVGRILPVAYDGHFLRLKSLMDEVEPALVIGFGLDTTASEIKLETQAFNQADFDIPDNTGAQIRNVSLSPAGPSRRASTFPANEIRSALFDAQIEASLSTDAGRYLCNATLFHLLGLCAAKPQRPLCGFVHVPYAVEQLTVWPSPPAGATAAALPLDVMIEAAQIVLRQCSQVARRAATVMQLMPVREWAQPSAVHG